MAAITAQWSKGLSGPARRSRPRPHNAATASTAAAIALASGGCSGVQSMLDPAGPAAAEIARTWWIMAGGAVLILLLVMVLLWRAMARSPDAPPFRQGVTMIALGGLAFPVAVLSALLVHGTAMGWRAMAMDRPPEHVIEVDARQWSWTFRYLADDGTPRASSQDVLLMPLGRDVEFRITAADVIHSFWIPRLGGKMDAIPGRTNLLRLRADQAVPIRGQCAEFCGRDHAHMAFEVVVVAPAEYEAWVAAGGGPLPDRAAGDTQPDTHGDTADD